MYSRCYNPNDNSSDGIEIMEESNASGMKNLGIMINMTYELQTFLVGLVHMISTIY